MAYKNRAPVKHLSDFIKCYWYGEQKLGPPNYEFEILPDSFIELVFCFGQNQTFIRKGSTIKEIGSAFVVGLLDSPIYIRCEGKIKTFGVRFYAWGFYPFIRVQSDSSATELDLMNLDLVLLNERLRECIAEGDINRGFEELEETLLQFLRVKNEDFRITEASKEIYNDQGKSKLKQFFQKLRISERQLNRVFNFTIGLGPKGLSKRVRFQHVRDAIFENPDISLTELAYEFNYTDQAHFINDFKAFANKTPSEFANEMKNLRVAISEYNSQMK